MKRLPLFAILLGAGGLIPFLGCTVAVLLFPAQVPIPRLVAALIDYGAVILSFLGAVHWGLALAPAVTGHAANPATQRLRLVLGVLPALVAWAALLISLVATPLLALLVLLLGFLLTALVEARSARHGSLPRGYMGLRWVLTGVVMLCLAAVLLARLAG